MIIPNESSVSETTYIPEADVCASVRNRGSIGANESVRLPDETVAALRALTQRESLKLSDVFFAAYNVLLYRYSGHEEIAAGVLNAGPLRNPLKDIFATKPDACFRKTALTGNMTARELLAQLERGCSGGSRHDDLPAAFCVQSELLAGMGFPGSKAAWTDLRIERGDCDLFLVANEFGGEYTVTLHYRSEIFDVAAMRRSLLHYINLLQSIGSNPGDTLTQLPMLAVKERQRLLETWNDTRREYPRDKCLHQLFEEQVARTPEADAVVFNGQRMSYAQLNARANQLAHYLRTLGVKPDMPVGISMDRSFELVVGIFAILKAGGAYVPLDPNYPKPHLKYMLDYSKIRVLLTETNLRSTMGDVAEHVLCVNDLPQAVQMQSTENPELVTTPNNLIYVIFTSGSTGKPKGVGVYHRGFGNLMHWFVDEFKLQDHERVLVVSSLSFDLTQKNYFAPLITGGTLHLLPSGHFDPQLIATTIADNKITLLNCTPSAFYPLVESGDEQRFEKLASLRHLFLGGEPISHSRLRPWFHSKSYHAEIVNTYGPTECSDIVAFHRLAQFDWSSKASVPIGRPVHNTALAVLSKDGALCPMGVLGELCVAGDGVGAGYINDPELTGKKFVAVPFAELPGKWMYRTGDLVRMRPDENLEFLGRIDHQVKIRGFRIELGEIETVLEGNPAVRQAVVVAMDGSSSIIQDSESAPGDAKQLAAYVVPQPHQSPTPADLRQYLKERLPEYMVPAAFVVLERFPLSPNGKVDKRALPEPRGIRQEVETPAPAAPAMDIEQALAEIWKEVLHLDKVGLDDNFFDIGGESLLIVEVHTKVEQKFKLGSSITTFFECPTINMLAKKLTGGEQPKPSSSVQDRARRQRQAMGLA
jgi:amino acid adenylation domain-containing protein